jgi:general secretion pathway protein G
VHRRARRAFTLIEVMIAIAIVIILIGIVGFNVIGQLDRAEGSSAQIQMQNIEDALEAFRVDMRRYPTEDEGVAVLWNREMLDVEDESLMGNWAGYLKDPIPTDPWGNEWQYTDEAQVEGRAYELWSFGPDGEEDTDDDIRSWSESDDDFGGDFPGGGAPVPPAGG